MRYLIPDLQQAKAPSRCCHSRLFSVAGGHNRRKLFHCELAPSHLHQGANYVAHHVSEESVGLNGDCLNIFSCRGDPGGQDYPLTAPNTAPRCLE